MSTQQAKPYIALAQVLQAMTVHLCKTTMMSATATMRQSLPEQQNKPSGFVPLSQSTTKCLLLKLPSECFGYNFAVTSTDVCGQGGDIQLKIHQ